MEHWHGTVSCMPIGVDAPEVVHFCRIRLPTVAHAHNPLKSGEILEFGQFHFAIQRRLGVLPAQDVRARLVALPIPRLDVRRLDGNQFQAASFAELERKRHVGDVTLCVRVSLSE